MAGTRLLLSNPMDVAVVLPNQRDINRRPRFHCAHRPARGISFLVPYGLLHDEESGAVIAFLRRVDSRSALLRILRRAVPRGQSTQSLLRRLYGMPSLHHVHTESKEIVPLFLHTQRPLEAHEEWEPVCAALWRRRTAAPIGGELKDLVVRRETERGRDRGEQVLEAEVRRMVFRDVSRAEALRMTLRLAKLAKTIGAAVVATTTPLVLVAGKRWVKVMKRLSRDLPVFVPLLLRRIARSRNVRAAEPLFELTGRLTGTLRPLAETVLLGKPAPPAFEEKMGRVFGRMFGEKQKDVTRRLRKLRALALDARINVENVVVPLRTVDVFLRMQKEGVFRELEPQ